MRSLLATAAACSVIVAWPPSASAAGYTDPICPQATQYVLAVGRVRTDDAPQRIYDVAHAAADAFAQCSKEKLSYGYREAQHYADTRSAGFGIVAARALIALGRLEEAQRDLVRDRALAQNVVDWQTETLAFQTAHVDAQPVTVESDHRPSMYRAAAREVVASADAVLEEVRLRLARRQAAESRPPGR